MRILVLLLINTYSMAQVDFIRVDTHKKDLCISLSFSPIIDDSINFDYKNYVKSLLPIEQFDRISQAEWKVDTSKCVYVEVRFREKNYTFKEFRKLIYE